MPSYHQLLALASLLAVHGVTGGVPLMRICTGERSWHFVCALPQHFRQWWFSTSRLPLEHPDNPYL